MAALLEVSRLGKSFRGVRAVTDVSFAVAEREIVSLIGPNGAGKTTVFNLIAGGLKPDTGCVRLASRDITGLRPDQICAAGIARTFQLVKPFPELTVLENVVVGALRGTPDVAGARAVARRLLDVVELGEQADVPAAHLTLPDRKRLEVARALATGPKLLLLDEVVAGLRPTEADRMVTALRRLHDEAGLTILLIEHVMRAVMALSDHIVVLHHGEKISEGTPEHVVRDPAVLGCYLGQGVR